MNLKSTALFLFLISLVPGDNFYLDLGLTQSLFLLPLLLTYIKGGKYLPSNIILRNAGIVFVVAITSSLIFSQFRGLIEWYRSIGGLILVFMIVALCSGNEINKKQIKWFAYAGSIPILAFYLGLWGVGDYEMRLTFLKHDPNHLGHLIVYSTIAILAFIHELRKIKKVWVWLITGVIFLPLAYTFSRTSLIGYFIVIILYLNILLGNRLVGNIVLFIFIFLIGLTTPLATKSVIVSGFTERFLESNEKRTQFNQSGLEVVVENFFTGVGVFKFQDPDWRLKNGFYRLSVDGRGELNEVPTATHNGFLDVFLIGGVFLFVAFIIILTYPIYFLLSKEKILEPSNELKWRKFLVFSFTSLFILFNLTYSLYYSKLGWWGIAFSYVLIEPYYSTTRNRVYR